MRWQTTAVLAVILAALGAFYYVWEIRLGPEREKTETRKGRVFTAEPKDVTEVELKRPDSVVKLKREGDAWQMLEPVKTRGDRGAIEDVVTSLATVKMDREIAAAPASLAEFGLDKPAAEVTLTLGGGQRLELQLGGKNPTGVWVYARERAKPAVFVVADGVLRDATRPAADFRDKTILAFTRTDVTGVDIAIGAETLGVEQSDGKWRITRPQPLPADADTVNDFLDKLQAAKVKTFVAEAPPSLEPFGLDRPARVAIHTGKDKERASRSLLIGRFDGEKKGVYAMRPGESSVLLVPDEVWLVLPKNVAVLRDKVVVEYQRDKVTRLDLESPKGTVTVVRDDNRWKISAPEALPADQVEVGALLARLRDLRAQGFLTDDASGIPRYLGKPEVRITLTEQGAAAPITLLIAPSPERRGGQPSAYAGVVGRGPVVLVDGKSLGDLARSVTELRDRTLVSGLEPRDVKRVRFGAGGKSTLVERRGEGDWRLLEPTKGAAKAAKVEDVLYMLRGLKWKEMAAPSGDEAARYGLDAPSLEIVLLKADGGEIATVLVGKREGDRAYVKLKSAAPIYAVDAKQLDALPRVPADDLKG